MGLSIIDLPWLPRSSEDLRQQLKAIAAGNGDWGNELRRIASCFIGLNQATLISKALHALKCERPSTSLTPLKVGLVSGATVEFLKPMLEVSALRYGLQLEICAAGFDQGMLEALNPDSSMNTFMPDAILLAFDHRGLPFQAGGVGTWPPFSADSAMLELNAMRSAFRRHCGAACVLQTIPGPQAMLFGSLDIAVAGTLRAELAKFNGALASDAGSQGDTIVDVEWLANAVGLGNWFDDRNWYIARLPFAQAVLPVYADFVSRALAAMRGKSRKCLVLDLDNTLWGGVIGDDGLDGISLEQGDARGESFRAIQTAAADLKQRGVVLAVCSKNDDRTARLPFHSHPSMILREEDIAVFMANWDDKATNLERIAKQLDIGLDALVLLDDNPAERALVRQLQPQVAVPELGPDPSTYVRTLMCGGYFESISFTAEDRGRAEQYRANVDRAALAESARDLHGFLSSLEMEIEFRPFDAGGRKRVTQLINKTNQFNLTTRRYTEAQVKEIESSDEYYALQVGLRDRFGDNGMISVVICRTGELAWHIDTWLMSCRVINRRVEESVLNRVAADAIAAGARHLVGDYIPTDRNGLVADLFQRLGFVRVDDGQFADRWVMDLDGFRPRDVPIVSSNIVRQPAPSTA